MRLTGMEYGGEALLIRSLGAGAHPNWPSLSLEIDCYVPISGTASEVGGIVSATSCRKTVNDRRIVTPTTSNKKRM